MSPQVDAFVLHLLEKLRDDRPTDAVDTRRQIDQLLRDVEAPVTRPEVPPDLGALATVEAPSFPPSDPPTTDLVRVAGVSTRRPQWAVGILIVLGVMLGVYVLWPPPERDKSTAGASVGPTALPAASIARSDAERLPDSGVDDATKPAAPTPRPTAARVQTTLPTRPRPSRKRRRSIAQPRNTSPIPPAPEKAAPPVEIPVDDGPIPIPPTEPTRTEARVLATGIMVPSREPKASASKTASDPGQGRALEAPSSVTPP